MRRLSRCLKGPSLARLKQGPRHIRKCWVRRLRLADEARYCLRHLGRGGRAECPPRGRSGGEKEVGRERHLNELLMSALLADVAKRTVEERMKNPIMPRSERFRWRWSKQKFVVAEVKPMWWTDLDTRAAKLQWVGNALTAISGTTIVVLGRGI